MGQGKKLAAGPYSQAVSDQIKAELTNQDRPQAWLSRQTGIPASSLSSYLRGRDAWPVELMVECARALGLDPVQVVRMAVAVAQLQEDALPAPDSVDADLRRYIPAGDMAQIDAAVVAHVAAPSDQRATLACARIRAMPPTKYTTHRLDRADGMPGRVLHLPRRVRRLPVNEGTA